MEFSLVSNILAKKNINYINPIYQPIFPAKNNINPFLAPDNFLSSVTNKGINLLPLNKLVNGELKGIPKATGYYPDRSKLEGGYNDKMGKKLCTLQDYLEGKVPYVSIALDKNLYKNGVIKYGDKFRIPELEAKYHRIIEFRAVDSGGAFTNKNFTRVDICARSKKDAWDKSLNGNLSLIKIF